MISYAIFYKFLLSLQILFLPWWWRHGFESVSDTFSENPMLKICSLSIHPLKGNHVSLSRAAWESTIWRHKNAIPWSQLNIKYGLRPELVVCELCTCLYEAQKLLGKEVEEDQFMWKDSNQWPLDHESWACHYATSADSSSPTFKNLTIFHPISIWADLMRGYQLLIFNLFQKSFIHHFSLAAILLSVIWKTCFMQSRWIKNALPGLLQCIQYTREAVNWNTRTERE